MNEKNLGIKDEPILSLEEDYLNLKDHAIILADFIKDCDTPMSIGIQGDWGSGKTSMMNMVKYLLENSEISDESIKCIWFNTWQYSQFNMENTLALSLISMLIEDIQEQLKDSIRSETKEKIDKTLKIVKNFSKLMARVGVAWLSQGAIDIEQKDDKEESKSSLDFDPSKSLKELKNNLKDFIDTIKSADSNPIKKFVIFIDDIDRLKPIKAIELLETLKLFLDVPGCIFVLACDYKIVMEGLKEKFGTTGEAEGKSFFDKIIQVPYNIPVHQYKISNYIDKLLKKVQINLDAVPNKDEIIIKYKNLLENSVGNNPRSYKRLFNSFLLFKKVIDYQKANNKDDYPFKEFEVENIINENEKYLIIFAVLCLQIKFEKAFYYIRENYIDDEWFKKFQTNTINEELEAFFKEIGMLNENEREQFLRFINSFYKAIQLESDISGDEKLSEKEIEVIKKIMLASNIIGAAVNVEEFIGKSKYEFLEYSLDKFKELLRDYDRFLIKRKKSYFRDDALYWKADHKEKIFYIYLCINLKTLRQKNFPFKIGLYIDTSQKKAREIIDELLQKDIDNCIKLKGKNYKFETNHREYSLWYEKSFEKNEFIRKLDELKEDFEEFLQHIDKCCNLNLK